MKVIKIMGIKKAVGDYKRANAGGWFSPRYGYLMLDMATGKVWTDEFYNFEHNDWNEYHDSAIINLGYKMAEMGLVVTMANVKQAATEACEEYKANDGRESKRRSQRSTFCEAKLKNVLFCPHLRSRKSTL